MTSQNLTARQILTNVTQKLRLQNVRATREQHGDFYLDGKFEFTVTMPNIHGAKQSSVSRTMLRVCRTSVFLNAKDFADLVRCPMTGERYEMIIREKLKSEKD